ncbi:MAG: hypothetical protein PHE55_00145 [Methylococcaceae bacterium]|nr:hypothetical protein [Methylococcaceae bacterium]
MFKFDKDTFMAYPLQTSLFLMDFAIVLFTPLIRPPLLISLVLVCGLVYLSMFFGAKIYVAEDKK